MKINSTQGTGAPTSRKVGGPSKTAGSAFSDMISGSETASSTSAGLGVAPVDALASLNNVDADERGNKNARGRADDMLDRLEDIRDGVLLGTIPKDRRAALATMAQQRDDKFLDPALREILVDIELRARVELAKLARD